MNDYVLVLQGSIGLDVEVVKVRMPAREADHLVNVHGVAVLIANDGVSRGVVLNADADAYAGDGSDDVRVYFDIV